MNTRFFILSAAVGAALCATPALASPASVSINYADLDLSTPQGQAKLDRRIARVADQTCGGGGIVTGSVVKSKGNRECVAAFEAAARQQIAAGRTRGAHQG